MSIKTTKIRIDFLYNRCTERYGGRRRAVDFLPSVLPVHGQTNQSAHGQARGTFRQVGFGLVEPGGSGDIQVDPGRILGELLEEDSCRHSASPAPPRSEEHTSELQSPCNLVCRLLLE